MSNPPADSQAGRRQRTAVVWTAILFALLGAAAVAWLKRPTSPTQPANSPIVSPMVWRDDLTQEERTRVAAATAAPENFETAQPFEANSGGAGSFTGPVNRNAFSMPAANLSLEGQQQFALGNALFRKIWVSSPASTQASDGLGPLFNARSCQRCHLKDGRGHPPASAEDEATSYLLRVSLPAETPAQQQALREGQLLSIPDPVYGGQIQDRAVPGLRGEGRISLTYTEKTVTLNGGETVTLRQPDYQLVDLGYGPMDANASLSPRVAQPMIGLGLLDAIHEGDLLAQADPDDADGDGISGRPQRVRDPATGDWTIGRFGWKAGAPSVRAQSAGAFFNDMGISSSLNPAPAGECTDSQVECIESPHGVQPALSPFEASDEVLDLVAFYSSNLAVPGRRDTDHPEVLAGKALFHEAQCAACHRPSYVTRRDAAGDPQQFQLIWPYTDLLLHDLGEDLSSHSPVGQASPTEWRTAPLWGIGLTEAVSGHEQLLHDGRARGLLEAILWHGGEAQASRDAVVAMEPEQREALLAFLRSL